MNLQEETKGKVFTSFAENFSFLLSCLKNGRDKQRLIFIIEEFDLFCTHHNQTLLYNLFDVAQSAQTPICVLGLTRRFDVVELLEKRVKSRFSHRQIFLLPDSDNFDAYVQTMKQILKLPTQMENIEFLLLNGNFSEMANGKFKIPLMKNSFDRRDYKLDDKQIARWNNSVGKLVKNDTFLRSLEDYFSADSSIGMLKMLLLREISKLSESRDQIKANDFSKNIDHILSDNPMVKLITGVSVLEICVLVAIKHHCAVYDNDPFNFEIIFTRFNKFAVNSLTMQNIPREMVLKRFESLLLQEVIVPIGADGKVQKEYQFCKLLFLPKQIELAIKRYQNLPTEIEQWSKSEIF